MEKLQGRPVVGGKAEGKALVTRMPVNFTASFSKPGNILASRRGVILDRHHELFKQDVKGRVLVFPACIGSTFTGMMLLQVIDDGAAPAAIVVQQTDSLLVSGPILGRAWLGHSFPIVEYRGDDLFERIRTGDRVEVDGDSGEIAIER
jgi:predicted aconitase with swiveling domain